MKVFCSFRTFCKDESLLFLELVRRGNIISFQAWFIDIWNCCLFNREDFERTGVSSLVTVGVRDIQGEGFPDQFSGLADSVFLDLPQPWLAIPSAGKMLKQDGVLCSFSPCIEQVQRACETLRSNFTGNFPPWSISVNYLFLPSSIPFCVLM